MVIALKVELKNAEKVRQELVRKGVLHYNYRIKRRGEFLLIPVTKKVNVKNATLVNVQLRTKQRKETIEEKLQKILTSRELKMLPRAHEMVGDILILEIPDSLKKKEKKIGHAFLEVNTHAKTVVKKGDIHSGVFRTRKVIVLAGKKKKDAIYKESGCRFHVNVEKMYFSARLGNERLRIAQKVGTNENVLVMFSGAAPYVCVIAKHSDAKKVTGIEINPIAHKFAVENVKKNNIETKVMLYNGDARKVLLKLNKFERIVMPLPKTGEEFFPLALRHIKKKGTIHYYAFLRENEINQHKKKIKKICGDVKKKCRVTWVKAGQHAPYVFRICYDVKVW
jgi:tRNA (guanine37-N1)-methyltransferase